VAMDARRSAKSRSVGTESKPSRTQRPELGERVHSAPTPARRRQSNAKGTSDSVKIAGVVDRGSKASIRDDPFFRSYDSPQSVRLAEQSHKGAAGLECTKDVCILPPSVRLAKLQIFLRIDVTCLTKDGTVKLR
jgi:hypothetical protein